MANVTFGFNGNEVTLPMEDGDAKELFHDITGVTIENIECEPKSATEMVHPTLDQLIGLFRENIGNEISTNLIRERFYPNYKGSWRRIITNTYEKIQKAMDRVELLENGKYLKRKEGKYRIYLFVRNNRFDKTLNDYL